MAKRNALSKALSKPLTPEAKARILAQVKSAVIQMQEGKRLADEELRSRGLPIPESQEDWEYLAHFAGWPPETIKKGDWNLNDVLFAACAFHDREVFLEHKRQQVGARIDKMVLDVVTEKLSTQTPLTQNQVNALRILSARSVEDKKPIFRADLAAELDIDPGTVTAEMEALLKNAFVAKPGERKGYAITDLGKAYLARS